MSTLPTKLASNPSVEAVIGFALLEWEHWGKSTWNTISGEQNIASTEASPGFPEYVYDNYYKAVVQNPDPMKRGSMIERIAQRESPHYAWSAVTISYIMKKAGYSKAQFQFSEGHSRYIRNAVAAKKGEDDSASFWGFRIGDAAPEVGDLVGYARKSSGTVSYEAGQAWYDKTGKYNSHADIVVAVRPAEIDVVGGNVANSVTKKTLSRDPDTGLLTDQSFAWFVVMKRRVPA